ncbi:MAG: hypothetical protein ABIT09_01235 [Croceibacterium sp.]
MKRIIWILVALLAVYIIWLMISVPAVTPGRPVNVVPTPPPHSRPV